MHEFFSFRAALRPHLRAAARSKGAFSSGRRGDPSAVHRALLGVVALFAVSVSGCLHAGASASARRAVWIELIPGPGRAASQASAPLAVPGSLGPGVGVRTVATPADTVDFRALVTAPTPDFLIIQPRFDAEAAARGVAAFAQTLPRQLASARKVAPAARVLLVLPGPNFDAESRPANDFTRAVAQLADVAYAAGVEPVHVYPDDRHATAAVRAAVDQPADTGFDVEKNLVAAGIVPAVTSFHGFRQLDFRLPDDRSVTIVRPYRTARGRPIVWRGEFFGHQPQVDLVLLNRGYHVVYVNARNLYGAPVAMRAWEEALACFRRVGLDGKIVLIGMSRGGLYCYNWAALHPETVAVLYGDAPVCDFKSWPGLKGRSTGPRGLWPELLKAYGFTSEAQALTYPNPIDQLAPLAHAGIPILHVIGLDDTAAVPEENSDIVEARYRALGGTIEVIRKPGVGHHPHSLPDPTPIVDFIVKARS